MLDHRKQWTSKRKTALDRVKRRDRGRAMVSIVIAVVLTIAVAAVGRLQRDEAPDVAQHSAECVFEEARALALNVGKR